jgi:hypothetical protein
LISKQKDPTEGTLAMRLVEDKVCVRSTTENR